MTNTPSTPAREDWEIEFEETLKPDYTNGVVAANQVKDFIRYQRQQVGEEILAVIETIKDSRCGECGGPRTKCDSVDDILEEICQIINQEKVK